MNTILLERVREARSIAILGHVRPDGDCTGAALALLNYLRVNAPEKTARVFLERPPEKFAFLPGFREIIQEPESSFAADLAIAPDVSDRGRLGDFAPLFDRAKRSFNVDHHVTNPHYADDTVCLPEASSSCEVLFGLLDPEKIDRETAACLYTGIIADSGVFKYAQTSEETMRIAGFLMKKGIPFGEIIDRAYYRKSFVQNRILGKALTKAVLELGGKLIMSAITLSERAEYLASAADLDGIAEQLRLTEGVECSLLAGETEPGVWKLSLRSLELVDVSVIAALYGGGGHIRAAGCTVEGEPGEIFEKIRGEVEKQLRSFAEERLKQEIAARMKSV